MKKQTIYMCVMMLLGVLSSCTDDDSFTTAPSHVLTLSVDTVNIDTVFSNVPTATRSFWVYAAR